MLLGTLGTWHLDVPLLCDTAALPGSQQPLSGTDTFQAPLAPSHPPSTKGSASSWSKRSGCLNKPLVAARGKALSQLCMASPNTQK